MLANPLGDLDEAAVVAGVDAELAAGIPGPTILEELQHGMELVGEKFAACEYYLSELIYAADIFKKVNGLLGESLQ